MNSLPVNADDASGLLIPFILSDTGVHPPKFQSILSPYESLLLEYGFDKHELIDTDSRITDMTIIEFVHLLMMMGLL